MGSCVGLAVRRSTPLLGANSRCRSYMDRRTGPNGSAFMAVALRADGIALAVGYAGGVHRSVDTGLTWTKTAQVASRELHRRRASRRSGGSPSGDRDAAIVVSDFAVMRSSDAGLTWGEVERAASDARWRGLPGARVAGGGRRRSAQHRTTVQAGRSSKFLSGACCVAWHSLTALPLSLWGARA